MLYAILQFLCIPRWIQIIACQVPHIITQAAQTVSFLASTKPRENKDLIEWTEENGNRKDLALPGFYVYHSSYCLNHTSNVTTERPVVKLKV